MVPPPEAFTTTTPSTPPPILAPLPPLKSLRRSPSVAAAEGSGGKQPLSYITVSGGNVVVPPTAIVLKNKEEEQQPPPPPPHKPLPLLLQQQQHKPLPLLQRSPHISTTTTPPPQPKPKPSMLLQDFISSLPSLLSLSSSNNNGANSGATASNNEEVLQRPGWLSEPPTATASFKVVLPAFSDPTCTDPSSPDYVPLGSDDGQEEVFYLDAASSRQRDASDVAAAAEFGPFLRWVESFVDESPPGSRAHFTYWLSKGGILMAMPPLEATLLLQPGTVVASDFHHSSILLPALEGVVGKIGDAPISIHPTSVEVERRFNSEAWCVRCDSSKVLLMVPAAGTGCASSQATDELSAIAVAERIVMAHRHPTLQDRSAWRIVEPSLFQLWMESPTQDYLSIQMCERLARHLRSGRTIPLSRTLAHAHLQANVELRRHHSNNNQVVACAVE